MIRVYVKPWLFVLQELSESFKAYVAQRDYKLHTVADYGQILRKVGFSHVSNHKVLTYVKYRAVSGVFQNIDPPPPLPPASVSYPRTKGGNGGVHTRRAVREGRGSIFWKTPYIGLASYSIISLRK
jgi:hypothetical protein